MKVLVEAYGCALNRGEAQEFADALLESGHEIVTNPEVADAFALFTCGVIDTTERRMLRRVRQFSKYPEKKLLVCGCLPNICPVKITDLAPHAILFGPAEQWAAVEHLTGGKTVSGHRKSNSVGILPIATGCLGDCSYCVTKNARGNLASRTIDDLAGRLENLVSAGAAEIQLCAQDTAIYGRDIGTNLRSLIESLDEVPGDFMVRIGMMNPANVMNEMKDIIAAYDCPKVFKFLHLPVQSGSDRVLELMRRHHTVHDFKAIVSEFRTRFPGMTLSTDVIVGFPGETRKDFEMSLKLMREVKPDIINVTRFSSRPGTSAHAMKPGVPGWRTKEWSRELSALRFGLTEANYSALKGQVVEAIATERRKPGTTFLRSREYKPVVVSGELELGRWYVIQVSGRTRTHITGKPESVK